MLLSSSPLAASSNHAALGDSEYARAVNNQETTIHEQRPAFRTELHLEDEAAGVFRSAAATSWIRVHVVSAVGSQGVGVGVGQQTSRQASDRVRHEASRLTNGNRLVATRIEHSSDAVTQRKTG